MTQELDISLILPAFNEEECIASTIIEAIEVLRKTGKTWEIIAVDDGSSDQTPSILDGIASREASLRILRLEPRSGQSAAFGAGFRAARGRITVLMDADGQNDPADIPHMIEKLGSCDVCCGWRKNRQDDALRSFGSRMANRVRNYFLHDGIKDTGCSLKAFKTGLVRDLPMNLRGMHRFLPALVRMKGAVLKQVAVNHRPRQGGKSKYTNLARILVTIGDLRAVRWMQSRYTRFTVKESSRNI
jgi:dolichol-phosphate mannosyltransferase